MSEFVGVSVVLGLIVLSVVFGVLWGLRGLGVFTEKDVFRAIGNLLKKRIVLALTLKSVL